MKQEAKNTGELVKLSKSKMFKFVASQIKGKSLFPKKIESAKKMLERARIVKH
jgi:hypothetical protein